MRCKDVIDGDVADLFLQECYQVTRCPAIPPNSFNSSPDFLLLGPAIPLAKKGQQTVIVSLSGFALKVAVNGRVKFYRDDIFEISKFELGISDRSPEKCILGSSDPGLQILCIKWR